MPDNNVNFDPKTPHNHLTLLPPNVDLESKAILRQLIASHRALAELKGYIELLPNKNIIINSIVLREAKDSSEIENIITTHDELYKSMILSQKKLSPQVKEVQNYREALFKGVSLVRENDLLTTNAVIEIQQILEKNNAGIRKLPGTKLVNDITNEVMYTPPDNESDIRRLLKNWEEFVNIDSQIDPLVKLAVQHYQFESIHPFYDGNGRTGRIINVLYLVARKLLGEPILYLSQFIIHHKNDYYQLLRQVTRSGNWEDWIIYILRAVEHTSLKTLKLSKAIVHEFEIACEEIKKQKPKIYSYELAELLFINVYTKISTLVDNGIASRNIASKYLNELSNIDILRGEKIGREIIYINKRLYSVLSEQ